MENEQPSSQKGSSSYNRLKMINFKVLKFFVFFLVKGLQVIKSTLIYTLSEAKLSLPPPFFYLKLANMQKPLTRENNKMVPRRRQCLNMPFLGVEPFMNPLSRL